VKRALVVCSGFAVRAEVLNSAACAEVMLRAHGFDVARCDGADATRDGIMAAYQALIASSEPDDAAVVYYAGHGGGVVNSQYTVEADLPREFQHICPTDFAETRDGDFRGISSLELSLLLAELNARTRNATTIFECCYAAEMTRGESPAPRAQITRVGVTAHLRRLRERARELPLAGSPDAIRVAAAGQRETARFVRLPPPDQRADLGLDGVPRPDAWIGAMTLGLSRLLLDARDKRVSWQAIAPLLRQQLAMQRPEIAGPVARLPFSLDVVSAVAFPVRRHRDGAMLEAGIILGVSKGDVYGVMPQGSTDIDDAALVAKLTIEEASAHRSYARVDWGHAQFPPGAVAIVKAHALPPYPVRIDAPRTARTAIAARLHHTGRLRPAGDDECALAELRLRSPDLELLDELGPLAPPLAYPARLDDAVHDVLNLATVKRLRDITPHGLTEHDVSVTAGVVAGGAFQAIANGDALGLHDRIAIRLQNTTDRTLWASLFNIGLRQTIAQVGPAAGIRLPPGGSYQFGNDDAGQLAGFELRWPAGLPRTQPRPDTVMTIVTTQPSDLSALQSTSGVSRSTSPLDALFDEIATTRLRTRGPSHSLAPEHLAIAWRKFLLFPIEASLDLGAIELDASPGSASAPCDEPLGSVTLEGLEAAPATRVDVLVCARSSISYRACTPRASGTSTVWTGDARDGVDVYLWTSTGCRERTLDELLVERPLADAIRLLDSPGPLARGGSLHLAALARDCLRSTRPQVATAFRGSFGSRGSCRYTTPSASFTLTIR